MKPLVSIITPLYNSEKYVEETIRSVQAQTNEHWELIITDDGSTDNSFSIVEKLAKQDNRIKLAKRESLPKGGSACRNIGISLSQGEYILFLDSDDLLYPHCLENRLRAITAEPNLDFAVFQMDKLHSTGQRSEYMTKVHNNYLQAFLSYNIPWQTSCPLWKSSFFKTHIVQFDPQFSRFQDLELHTRALIVDDVNFKVFPDTEFLDCSYRVDYKKPNLSNHIEASILYASVFSDKVRGRNDGQECINSLALSYETTLGHYSGQSKDDVYSCCNKMKELNKRFYSLKIISYKKYFKTKLFLYLIKYKVIENRTFTALMSKLGFRNFYNLNFCNFAKENR